MERARAIMGEGSNEGSNGFTDLQHAGRQLEQASSNLRALLGDPVPDISSPVLDPEYSGEAEHNRMAKRRKLDSDPLDSTFAGFLYGRRNGCGTAKSSFGISSTISKDNTLGDCVRNASILADFGRKHWRSASSPLRPGLEDSSFTGQAPPASDVSYFLLLSFVIPYRVYILAETFFLLLMKI
jgi:hypothetical protein